MTDTISTAPHAGTLEVIRKITDDGILTEREVWDLAEYLNDDSRARADWPGNTLYPILHEVFEDGVLSNEEMERLAGVLSEVEHQCAKQNTVPEPTSTATTPEPPTLSMDAIKVERYELPKVQKTVEIPCKPSGELYRVDLAKHTCTCPAWFGNRKKFEVGNPRRACVHIIDAFWKEITDGAAKNIPRIFANMVEELSNRGRGIDHQSDWKFLQVDTLPHIVSTGHPEWNAIYAPGEGVKFDRFAYSVEEQRWAYGRAPRSRRYLEQFLHTAA
jgi:hypothetical protein